MMALISIKNIKKESFISEGFGFYFIWVALYFKQEQEHSDNS